MSSGSCSGSRPCVVAGGGDEARAGEAEGLQRREVGGVLDEHDVVGVDEHARDEAERLLRAGRDEDLVRFGGQAPAGEPLCEQRAQLRVALGGRVLQRPRDDGGRERSLKACATISAGNSSGAGRPPANEMTSARWVSFRMSRTGEDWTSASRAESEGSGRGISSMIAVCRISAATV